MATTATGCAEYVDKDHLNVPATDAHENLHALAHAEVRQALGHRLEEGITQYLASRIMPELRLVGEGVAYPQEVLHAEQLAATVGDEPIRQAYFRGEVGELRDAFDRVAGEGSFEVLRATIGQRDDEAAQRTLVEARGSQRAPAAWGLGRWRSGRGCLEGRQLLD